MAAPTDARDYSADRARCVFTTTPLRHQRKAEEEPPMSPRPPDLTSLIDRRKRRLWFFKVATLCFDDCFAHSWHSLDELQEDREELRRSSVILFGNLTKFSSSRGGETLFEQILNGLVTLLLHLQDPKPDVVKACKFALQMCAPSLNNQGLADMFTTHLHPDRGLHFGEFMNDVCKHLLLGYPDMTSRLIQTNISYFKSIWPDIRAAAPLFIGIFCHIRFLVLHMQPDQCKMVDLDHLVSSLIVLLKDPVPPVRMKASETMGRLVKFV
ncbi:unnamed protein product [Ranitomeya imitator]|uniref:Maestro/Maestro-like HEAT-repeats domain-containing protein n=1 Tax=Ranitomeya imitator TaxID=111125 RepID=A0ABN9LHN3_9NEOB|nr:unnamed protein product [Ranitomeya imitator]